MNEKEILAAWTNLFLYLSKEMKFHLSSLQISLCTPETVSNIFHQLSEIIQICSRLLFQNNFNIKSINLITPLNESFEINYSLIENFLISNLNFGNNQSVEIKNEFHETTQDVGSIVSNDIRLDTSNNDIKPIESKKPSNCVNKLNCKSTFTAKKDNSTTPSKKRLQTKITKCQTNHVQKHAPKKTIKNLEIRETIATRKSGRTAAKLYSKSRLKNKCLVNPFSKELDCASFDDNLNRDETIKEQQKNDLQEKREKVIFDDNDSNATDVFDEVNDKIPDTQSVNNKLDLVLKSLIDSHNKDENISVKLNGLKDGSQEIPKKKKVPTATLR